MGLCHRIWGEERNFHHWRRGNTGQSNEIWEKWLHRGPSDAEARPTNSWMCGILQRKTICGYIFLYSWGKVFFSGSIGCRWIQQWYLILYWNIWGGQINKLDCDNFSPHYDLPPDGRNAQQHRLHDRKLLDFNKDEIKCILIGGYNRSNRNTIYVWDSEAETWSSRGHMKSSRREHGISVITMTDQVRKYCGLKSV